MPRSKPVAEASLAAGVGFALSSLLITAAVFPRPTGNDVGPNLLFWLVWPTAALGGVLLGTGLGRYRSREPSRVGSLLLRAASVAAVLGGSVVYGRVVAPSYFDAEVISGWYGLTGACALLVVAVQEALNLLGSG
jgi:hypothetical protein